MSCRHLASYMPSPQVLNHYVYFYENKCPTITEKYVSALIAFINDKKGEAAGEVRASRRLLWVRSCVCV